MSFKFTRLAYLLSLTSLSPLSSSLKMFLSLCFLLLSFFSLAGLSLTELLTSRSSRKSLMLTNCLLLLNMLGGREEMLAA